VATNKRLVNHSDARTGLNVMSVDTSSLCDPNSKSVNVLWADHLKCRPRTFGKICSRSLAHDRERHAKVWTTSGYTGHNGNIGYAGHGFDPIQHLPVIGSDLLRSFKTFVRYRELKCKSMFTTNAQVHAGQIPKTFQRHATCS